jgi:GTP diphosphokinase / guanosine-3',5'-bis(diphosphate) 3'-diphosphatase
VEEWKDIISRMLQEQQIPFFSIKWRLKSPYRIYEKLYKKYKTFDVGKVTDVLAFRVITDSISNCYTILWHIHSTWRPLIQKIKDYISIPKFNNYQSIHTTVLGMFPYPVEIQIRTQQMEDIAEHGVAAHFLYAQGKSTIQLNDKQSQWIKDLQSIVSDYTNTDGQISDDKLKKSLSVEFLSKSVFVYTPKWDIVEMPLWSTVLDFAFRIHSDVWLSFKNAIVNGVIKPINYTLKTWDIVSINTFHNKKTATSYWMEFLQSPTAKNKLQKYLREDNIESIITLGKEQITKKLLERELPSLDDPQSRFIKNISEKEFDELVISVSNKQRTPGDVVRSLYKDVLSMRKVVHRSPLAPVVSPTPIIDHDHTLTYRLCPECNPSLHDKIICVSSKRWIVIHTLRCAWFLSASKQKLLEAHWSSQESTLYTLTLILTIPENTQTLVGLMWHLAQLGWDMNNVLISKSLQGSQESPKTYCVTSTVILQNPNKAHTIIHELRQINKDYGIMTRWE